MRARAHARDCAPAVQYLTNFAPDLVQMRLNMHKGAGRTRWESIFAYTEYKIVARRPDVERRSTANVNVSIRIIFHVALCLKIENR